MKQFTATYTSKDAVSLHCRGCSDVVAEASAGKTTQDFDAVDYNDAVERLVAMGFPEEHVRIFFCVEHAPDAPDA
ncbi:MAG: hypothetical protein EG823_08295 [Actinobacteria bacterium]|nr:hypothetical protein [Actinomycetota bacterium]